MFLPIFLIVLSVFAALIAVHVGTAKALANKDSFPRFVVFILSSLFAILVLPVSIPFLMDESYRQGQIDQASGKNAIHAVEKTYTEWQPATKSN